MKNTTPPPGTHKHHYPRNIVTWLCAVISVLIYLDGCQKPDNLAPSQDVTFRTTFSTAAALDYLNDSLNIWYCRPGDEYDSTLVFIDTFEISVDGSNQISKEDLEDLAQEIADTAGVRYYSRSTSNKAPFMFEVRQAGNISGGKLPVQSWFIMEENDPTDESDAHPYSDSWPYGEGAYLGCPTVTGVDAPDLFRRDLRKAITYGGKHGKGNFAYNRLYIICFAVLDNSCYGAEMPGLSSDETIDGQDLINPDDVTPYDNLLDYLVFYNYDGYDNYHVCLTASEMNSYYDFMIDLAEDQLGGSGVGSRVIVQIECGYEGLYPAYHSYIFHNYQVLYANIITAANPPLSLPES